MQMLDFRRGESWIILPAALPAYPANQELQQDRAVLALLVYDVRQVVGAQSCGLHSASGAAAVDGSL